MFQQLLKCCHGIAMTLVLCFFPVYEGLRLCTNCYKQGHIAADFTNDKACNDRVKTSHLARECEPICNMCSAVLLRMWLGSAQNQACLEISWRFVQQWLPWHSMRESPPVWTNEQGLHGPILLKLRVNLYLMYKIKFKINKIIIDLCKIDKISKFGPILQVLLNL